jgi:hypothetical protein
MKGVLINSLHSFFSEAAKFTRKTIGIEITNTVLDEICKVIEIKSTDLANSKSFFKRKTPLKTFGG